MSIESWDPNTSAQPVLMGVEKTFVDRCLTIARDEKLDHLAAVLSDADKKAHSCIQASAEHWHDAIGGYSNEELILLIRFFAAIEMQLSEWNAGSASPAIIIYRLLKSRGEKLDKSELLWLREHSNNRYIPNGGIL